MLIAGTDQRARAAVLPGMPDNSPGHQRRYVEFAQFRDDVRGAGVVKIRHVLFEGDANDADLSALDRALGGDQQFDQTLRDEAAPTVAAT